MTAVDDWARVDADPGDDPRYTPDPDDPDEPDDEHWQLPPGQHLVITRTGAYRIAKDLPDINDYQPRSST